MIQLSYDSRLNFNEITTTNNFNVIRDFAFRIEVSETLAAGTSYSNPVLGSVVYNVFGILDQPTPSGFPAFDLMRTIGGAEFYDQGSSLAFDILTTADLSDGVQVSELGSFEFNGRELDTGRFHPSIVILNNNGSGSLYNSNNLSTSPPAMRNVNVDFRDEYDVSLAFNPNTLTVIGAQPKLVNISTRGMVGTEDGILIAGFVISGDFQQQVLIRSAGPTLSEFDIPVVLEDTVLTLFTSGGTEIIANTNWGDAANAADIAAAAEAVGAFSFPAGSTDSAILTTLDPGSYTAQVRGNSGATGVALVEVYSID